MFLINAAEKAFQTGVEVGTKALSDVTGEVVSTSIHRLGDRILGKPRNCQPQPQCQQFPQAVPPRPLPQAHPNSHHQNHKNSHQQHSHSRPYSGHRTHGNYQNGHRSSTRYHSNSHSGHGNHSFLIILYFNQI